MGELYPTGERPLELSVITFLFLRDCGALASTHGKPSPVAGKVLLTEAGAAEISSGRSFLRCMRHYYLARQGADPYAVEVEESKSSPEMRARNWSVVARAFKELVGLDLPLDRLQQLVAGDSVELILLLKQLQELTGPLRRKELEKKKEHKKLVDLERGAGTVEMLSKKFDVEFRRRPVNAIVSEKPWRHAAQPHGNHRSSPAAPSNEESHPPPPPHAATLTPQQSEHGCLCDKCVADRLRERRSQEHEM
jgi:hypothetical protein